MAREPDVSPSDVESLKEMISWVKRARDQNELFERVKGLQAFVELHPRLREAARAYAPNRR